MKTELTLASKIKKGDKILVESNEASTVITVKPVKGRLHVVLTNHVALSVHEEYGKLVKILEL
jgi:hypothetical protein